MEKREIYSNVRIFRENSSQFSLILLNTLISRKIVEKKILYFSTLREVLTINWADFVVGVEHVDNLLKHGFNGQSVLNHGANILKMKVD